MTYISRADAIAAIEAIDNNYGDEWRPGYNAALDDALAAINALPAVPVTDDMVERALIAYVGNAGGGRSIANAMRAALEAALPDAPCKE